MEISLLTKLLHQASAIINNPEIQALLFFPKLFLAPLGIFFLFFIMFALVKSSFLHYLLWLDTREFATFRAFGVRRMAQRWERALGRLETVNEAEYKLAIIEVDSMLDEALKRLGFAGETLDERLQNVPPTVISNLAELKEAHRTRNNIVHDPNFILSLNVARRVTGIYEQSLKELDLI